MLSSMMTSADLAFGLHCNAYVIRPTACSKRMIYSHHDPASKYIVFIHIPDEHKLLYYHARALAEVSSIREQDLLTWESLIEVEISTDFLFHIVSLQMLVAPKLLAHISWLDLNVWNKTVGGEKLTELPCILRIRKYCTVDEICDYYHHNSAAANTALCFGFQAPTGSNEDELTRLLPTARTTFWEGWRSIDSGIRDFSIYNFTGSEYYEMKRLLNEA